ncbi:MAG: efflux RND transporter permease subunit [Deltaproteobacteria bacterium]|nr:efflux RND transporter permease subunit [Deltaproteobacteria bacterium]
MELASLAVRRAITFGMIYVFIVGFGLFALARLQLDMFPDISFPMVIVITTYTGASPEDIETLVTRPIEEAVSAVKDTEKVTSTSKQGMALIMAEFDWGKDMAQAETDVRRSIDMMKRYLPTDADEPLVIAMDPALQPIVVLVMTGPYPLDELRRIAEKDMQPRFERLAGIAGAEVSGGLEREVQVTLDPTKVAAFGLDVNAVVGAIYQGNIQAPGGSVQQGRLDFTIQTHGKYQRVADIGEVVVGVKPGLQGMTPITLKEVAKVADSFVEAERRLEVDGQPAIIISVRKQSGANTVRAAEAVMDALPGIKAATGANVQFQEVFNQAQYINESLGNLSETAILGIIITFLTLLFFLRELRSALIVASAIPVSVIATFGIMDRAHMTLNIISMAGLALAIGHLVDTSIVVLENIFRLRQQGESAWDAAIKGARGVSLAVTASTLTSISVFFPVLFVPGIAGALFEDMAITICFSMTASLVVSLTLVPLAASRLLSSKRAAVVLERVEEQDVLRAVRVRYRAILEWIMHGPSPIRGRKPGNRWVVGAGVAGLLGLTALLLVFVPTDFIHADDNSEIYIGLETAVGNNVDEAYAVAKEAIGKVESAIAPEERRLIALDIGVGKGFESLFGQGVHAGNMRVPLVQPGLRKRSQKDIEDALRSALKGIPGLKATVGDPMNFMGGQGDVEIQIRGHDLEVARQVGLELKDSLQALADVSAVSFSIQEQKPELRVNLDRPKLAQLGLSSANIANAISTFFKGKAAGRFSDQGSEYDILVRYAKEHRRDVVELEKMPVVTMQGQAVPLANVAQVQTALGPVDISRLDQGRVSRLWVYLKADYQDAGGDRHIKDMGASIDRIRGILTAYNWPKDFSFTIGGTAETFMKSFQYLALALLLSVFLVYMVMASQFESFREPFIIMFTVPLAAIGVVPLFALTGSSMDIMSLIGVIMLVGIVVNNGIVMVDAANQLRAEFPDRRRAAIEAALQRLRPVLLTALTTIFGMVPLALGLGQGAATWAGLAKAVIGGLTVATFLTLFLVPVVYSLFAPKEAPAHVEHTTAAGGAA